MKIKQIRNATLVISYGEKKFLIDPWLQDKGMGMTAPSPDEEKNKVASPLVELPCPVNEILEGVDACIITHLHPDHFTPEYLPKEMPFIVQNEEEAEKLKSMGFFNITIFDNEIIMYGDIRLVKTKGMHGENEETAGIMGTVCGIVFQHYSEPTIYLAGDTVWYDEVKNTINKYLPQLIILNACDARIKGLGRLIMNETDVSCVIKHAPDATIMISHMDTVNHGFLTRKKLEEYLIEEGLMQNVVIPKDGEVIDG